MQPGVEVRQRLVWVVRGVDVVRMCIELEEGPVELVECLELLLEFVGAALTAARAEVLEEVRKDDRSA
jgi:hypothetical protein